MGGAEDYLAIIPLVVNVIDCRESVMDEVVLVSERSICAISHSHTASMKRKYCHHVHYCALILWAMKAVIVGSK